MQRAEPTVPLRPVERAGTGALGDADYREDATLLAACRNGDAQAWDTLVARYERLIFTVARRNGLSREDAADVTQTTFVALLDSIGRLRDEQRLPYWLMTVARRQAWRLRDRGREELSVAWMDTETVDPIPEYERVAAVHEGLGRLGGPCRDLLLALYFDPAEPSYGEIALRLGRAVGSLGPMRARCLQKLRRVLGDEAAS